MSDPTIRLDLVTPELLTRMLAPRWPGIRVADLEVLKAIPGTATKLQLRLRYAAGGEQAPETMWLKGGLEAHSVDYAALYATEAGFYREFADTMSARCPHSWYAPPRDGDSPPYLLLEDLVVRGVHFGDARHALDVDTARCALDALAQIHAAHWGRDLAVAHPWLPDAATQVFPTLIEAWTAPAHWREHLALPRGAAVSDGLRDAGRIRAGLLALLRVSSRAHSGLIHGDAHVGNLYVDPAGSVGYLDWQTVMRGCWAHDVAEFCGSALDAETRRRHEGDLLRGYLVSLRRFGADAPSFDVAWTLYRQHMIWAYMWVLCPVQLQAEAICTINAARAVAAINELGTLAALGVQSG